MIRNTKKAFTLVELIVVITILAVLGTIAFISLQGYSGEARDSKRLSDVNNLVKKVNIELSKGTSLTSLITQSGSTLTKTIATNTGATAIEWTINFLTIKENQADFQDKVWSTAVNYRAAYAIGGTGTGAYKFIQVATVSEALNNAVVVGNYYKISPSTDSAGLIGSGTWIFEGSSTLPYSLTTGAWN